MKLSNKKPRKPTVERETELKIIKYWKTAKNNSIPVISKKFKLTKGIVNRIIDDSISGKIK